MLSRLLRRLQGRTPSRPAPHALDERLDRVAPQTVVFDEPMPDRALEDVQAAFLAHLLDVAPGMHAESGVAADTLARLDALAAYLDVARLPRLPAVVSQLVAALRRG